MPVNKPMGDITLTLSVREQFDVQIALADYCAHAREHIKRRVGRTGACAVVSDRLRDKVASMEAIVRRIANAPNHKETKS